MNPSSPEGRTAPGANAPQAAGKILVMDDEESIRQVLGHILRQLGYTVETTPDGASAVHLVERDQAAGAPFNAAILDLTVPGGLGAREIAAPLKRLQPSLVLIASSGYTLDPFVSHHVQLGFAAFLPKPYTVAQVSDLLESLVSPAE